jgi:hypothetical protein
MLSLPLQVRVYRNITKNCWSIKSEDEELGQRVIGHAQSVILGIGSFKVSEAGRDRVRKEKRKNVHAWVTGMYIGAYDLEYCPAVLEYLAKADNTAHEAVKLQATFRNSRLLEYTTTFCNTLTNLERIKYNPYVNDHFVTLSGDRVKYRSRIVFTTDGHVYAQK